jgi:uncharacterized protein (DUF58 family)
MTWWARLRAKLEGNIRQRITKLGYAYAAATVLVGVGAFVSANNLLFLILSMMLAALLVSGLVSRLGLGGLEVDLEMPPHVSARVPAMGRVRIRNHKAWMPSFSIHLEGSGDAGFSQRLYFPVIPGGQSVEESVPLLFPRRGQYREDSFIFSSRFPFGFTERRIRVRIERDVLVYPSILAQPDFDLALDSVEGETAARLPGGGDDFHRLRPYENDSARHVDWKATARTGELQVREYVRQENPPVEIVLDIACPWNENDWFERAVDCCAYLVWNLSERRRPFRFRSQTVDLHCPEQVNVYDILRFLAVVEPRASAPPIRIDEPNTVRLVLSLRDPHAVRLRAEPVTA